MNIKHENSNPIEVEFHDVIEDISYQNMNTNQILKPKKLPLRMVVAALEKKARNTLNNKTKVVELVTKALSFCKKLGNISFLKKWFLDIPTLCDMLIDTITGTYKTLPYSSLVMVAIAILYAVAPFDLLHDAIPIVGVLDDFAILKAVLSTVKNDLESYTTWKETDKVA